MGYVTGFGPRSRDAAQAVPPGNACPLARGGSTGSVTPEWSHGGADILKQKFSQELFTTDKKEEWETPAKSKDTSP
jgi:hypothetical protein